MENPQIFSRLFSKYLDNRCSPEEIDHLMRLLQSEEYKTLAAGLIENKLKQKPDIQEPDSDLQERLDRRLRHIFEHAAEHTLARQRHIHTWRWIAAACIAVTLSAGLYLLALKSPPSANNIVAKLALSG